MILGIVQARLSSTRLPGKVMRPILGQPMIQLQLERTLRARKLDKILVATSAETSDDPLAAFCENLGFETFRGSLNDVLDRFHAAALTCSPRHVVRMTADCPLLDWSVLDRCIDVHLASGADYTSNTIERTYPKGLDIEVMTEGALGKAWRCGKSAYEREHVTPYIYHNPSFFKVSHVKRHDDISSHRWTVDEDGDFRFVKTVYEALYREKPDFTSEDVMALSPNTA